MVPIRLTDVKPKINLQDQLVLKYVLFEPKLKKLEYCTQIVWTLDIPFSHSATHVIWNNLVRDSFVSRSSYHMCPL